MSEGCEFQVCGAATENARHANSVHVLAADSSGTSEDHKSRTQTAGWSRSFRYAGVKDKSTLNVTSLSCMLLVASLAASEATGEVV